MDTANQQRILGYFIEEAKEHLQTLEKGILQLSTSAQDAEMVNEMFRAAHSVKGGAAMLGYTSIQKTAHRLEDAFKMLKESSIDVDNKLESLFLDGYDYLKDLVERLENSAEFSDNDAIEILEQAESNFTVLQKYLQELNAGVSLTETTEPSIDIAEQVKETLKQMLQLFKQEASTENRQKLQQLCLNLGEIAPEEKNWQNLLVTAQKALTNTRYPYNTIAQIVIKELKISGDRLHFGQIEQIVPSKNLQQLANTATATSTSQVMLPTEPKAAAITLMKTFNRQQLVQIVQIISSKLQG
ncbi:MAG: Hpt domain-containing protein [Xenococcaceae cyanobacterium MO_188.B29]|nr:Hpt domain-containing protein [Xenococcaceae cyanobacterium MO_188.B29]